MAKLFNNIRKTLISEKPSKSRSANYIKYAIGEIVLVMIGILLAIQANNWNVIRNAKTELNQSLNKLLIELNQDTDILNREIDENTVMISALDSCLIILKEPEKYTFEKFEELFVYSNYTNSFEFTRVTFDALSNSGKLKQIKNSILSDSLINYYGNSEFKQVENALVFHVRNNFRSYALGFDYLYTANEFDTYSPSDFNITRKTLNDYRSDVRIINTIRVKILLHRFLNENYKDIIPRTEYLIKTIKQELE